MFNLKKHSYQCIQNIWERSKNLSQLSFGQKIIFYFLCGLEIFYKTIFAIVCWIKKVRGNSPCAYWKVISVGNISVGGTGKSVFSSFLIKHLSQYSGALFLRGYTWKSANKKQSHLVEPNDNTMCDVNLIGDEACMLSQNLKVPVVVGKDRLISSNILYDWSTKNHYPIDYILLDDAYQNYALKKDFEILLIDARSPFENNHCLPAGRLREKDITRAQVVVFTHADEIAPQALVQLENDFAEKFPREQIFAGSHTVVGIYDECKKIFLSQEQVNQCNVVAFAGIGSFSGFKTSVQRMNIRVVDFCEFPDHYEYQEKDMQQLISLARRRLCSGLLTTQKDWQKIASMELPKNIPVFTLPITFTFSSQVEHERFFDLLNITIGWRQN